MSPNFGGAPKGSLILDATQRASMLEPGKIQGLSFFLPATTYKLQLSINVWVVAQCFLRSSTFTTAGSKFFFVLQRYSGT